MDKLKMHSPDLTERNIDKIAELFPTVMTEQIDEDGNPVRAIDFDLLRQELSGHVIEGPQERYQLDWPGKRAAAFTANAPISKTLRPVREKSVDFDTTKNLFIEGDNLDALKLLQESYLGKVKLIYIDPPYNTGRDFVYNDDFAETTEEYLERSGQIDEEGSRLVANSESNGRFHSDWLSMMYPRLKLARTLLSENGVILMSIDDNEADNLQKIANEIFGEGNQVGVFCVTKAEGGGLAKHVIKGHDYLLAYARSIDAFKPLMRPKDIRGKVIEKGGEEYWIEEDWLRKEFGKYGTCPYEDIITWHGESKKAEIDDGIAAGAYVLIPKGGKHIVGRYRKVSEDGSKFYSILKHLNKNGVKDLAELDGLDRYFDYPKPVSLVKEMILGATIFTKNEGEIVLDFFAGSGTTAQAVMQLNAEDGGDRRYILVQLPENTPENSNARNVGFQTLADVSRRRVTLAGQRAKEAFSRQSGEQSGGPDIGFRALRVDTTNLTDLLRTPDEAEQEKLELQVDSVKPDRNGEDLLFQVLLDWGLKLSLPIETEQIDGREVFSVDDGALIACFAPETTPAVVREIAERAPLRAVFRDSAFATDAERINAEQVFAEVSPSTDVKVI